MRSHCFALGVAGVLAASFFSFSAHAHKAGITGYSGKQGSTTTCMSAGCHANNPHPSAPELELTGPTSLAVGATGDYTLIIRGGPGAVAGMNAALSNSGGTLTNPGDGLKVIGGELTHSSPKPFAFGEARFDFSLVAPSTARTVTLYVSGNSANGNNANDGDHSASKTLDITVTSSSTSPDAGPGNPPPDAGTGPGNPPPGNGGNEDDGGCSTAGGAPVLLLFALVAAGLRRRGRQARGSD